MKYEILFLDLLVCWKTFIGEELTHTHTHTHKPVNQVQVDICGSEFNFA